MTHEEVKRAGTVAKYLQGGLSDREREEFEEHLFGCPKCAGIVQADLILKARGEISQSEEAAEEDDEEENGGSVLESMMLDWVALHPRISAAALVVATFAVLLVGYQNLIVIPDLQLTNEQLSMSHALDSYRLRRPTRGEGSASPGGEQVIQLPRGCLRVAVRLDLHPDDDFPSYAAQFVGDSGSSFEIPHEPSSDQMALNSLVSCSKLIPGTFTLKLYGVNPEDKRLLIEQIRFEVSRH